MKRTTLHDKTEKVGITLPISLVKQTDKARDDIPRVHLFEEQSSNIFEERVVNDLVQNVFRYIGA
jgi:hypothetical protein